MSSYQLTDEQIKIIGAVQKQESPILKVKAFAGTGKTSTLVEAAKSISGRKLYLAFNEGIKREAEPKFAPYDTEVKTTHALAHSYIVKDHNIKVKKANYVPQEIVEKYDCRYEIARRALDYLSSYCHSAQDGFTITAEDYNDKSATESFTVARQLFQDMLDKKISMTHDVYLKIFEMKLKVGYIKPPTYKLIMLDEAQDTNDVTLSIFYLMSAQQKLIVGDSHQQIYSFRGSIDAMDKVEAELFVLTNSFRFTKEIGDKANNFLTKFRNEKLNINGRAESREILPEDDTVAYLTRSNAKLISIIAEFMVQEKPIKVVRDPELIFGLAINMERLKYDNISAIDEDFNYLKSFAKEWERLILKGDSEFETIFEYIVSIIQDEEDEIVRTIKLLEKYKYIDPIYQYARKYYKTKDNILISVTTAHAAKGLEWEHVIVENDFPEWGKLIAKWFKSVDKDPAKIAHPFQYFVKNCKKQEYIDEFNLYYVAITRGKYLVEDHTWFNNLPEQESEYDEHIMNAFSEDIKIKVGKKKKSKKNLLIPY